MPTGPRSLWTLQLSPFLPLHYFAAVSLIRLMPMTALILIKHHYWSSDAHIWEIQWEFLVKRFNIFPLFFSKFSLYNLYIEKFRSLQGWSIKSNKKKNLKKRKIEQTFHSVQFVHSVHFTYPPVHSTCISTGTCIRFNHRGLVNLLLNLLK